MKLQRFVFVGALIVLFIITIFASLYFGKPKINFSELIENENTNDISLKIHYVDPDSLMEPLSFDELVSMHNSKKIVVSGSDLEEHIDLFKEMDNYSLTLVIWKTARQAFLRVYYVLESKKNGKLFEVAMWGNNYSVFVNGVEVKGKPIFYDVIIPFLSKDSIYKFHFNNYE